MKKIIIALILVAGVGALVYYNMQSANLSKVERDQAGVLLAELGEPLRVNLSTINTGPTKPAKPGCRNTLACNYDKDATEDGGVCEYSFYTLSTDSDELFTWWKQLTAKLEQEGKLSKTNQASVLLAGFDPSEIKNIPPPPPPSLSNVLDSKNKDTLESILKPLKKCLAGTKCQLVSIVTWNAPASQIDPLSNITFTPFGYVAKRDDRRTPSDIKDIEGRKACNQVEKPATPVNKKTFPTNSKIKR